MHAFFRPCGEENDNVPVTDAIMSLAYFTIFIPLRATYYKFDSLQHNASLKRKMVACRLIRRQKADIIFTRLQTRLLIYRDSRDIGIA